MNLNAIMRWGGCVVAATCLLARNDFPQAQGVSEAPMVCGAAFIVAEPLRMSVLPAQARHNAAATCGHPAAGTLLAQTTDTCEQDPTDPTCVCVAGENDADCLDGVHRG